MIKLISSSGVFQLLIIYAYEGTVTTMKENSTLYVLQRLCIALGCGIISLAVLIAIFSAIALATGDPEPLLVPLGLTSLALSCIATGIFSARLCGETLGYPLSSLSASVVFVLIMFLTSLFFVSDNSQFNIGTKLIVYAGMILFGLSGGILGKTRKKKKGRHIHRKKR